MKCKYCKKPAGFFSLKHKECEKKHQESLSLIRNKISDLFIKSSLNDYLSLKEGLKSIIAEGYVTDKEFNTLVLETTHLVLSNDIKTDSFIFQDFVDSFPNDLKQVIISHNKYIKYWTTFFDTYFNNLSIDERISNTYISLIDRLKTFDKLSDELHNCFISFVDNKISYFLEDNLIDNEEEAFLTDFLNDLSLREQLSNSNNKVYKRLVQCLILKDLREGQEITRLKVDGLPILLGKKEQILWVEEFVSAYEEKTGKRYEGASRGVSIRICKGVYYKTGASKGYPVEYQYNKSLGVGAFVITNKHVYFLGDKQVKLAYNKILSFEEYSDGITLIKDGVNPKPYTFVGVNAWFLINAIQLSNV
jgi:hypothetical protein